MPKNTKIKRNFVNLDEIDGNLQCSICLDVLIVPALATCNHRFCFDCIKLWIENCARTVQPTCPNCRQHIVEVTADFKAFEEIQELDVKCVAANCKWIGPLKSLEKHVNKDCSYGSAGLPKWFNNYAKTKNDYFAKR